MTEPQAKLNEHYQKSAWAVLLISGVLLIAHLYEAELQIPFLPVVIANAKDTLRIVNTLLGFAVVYQLIQWHLCSTRARRDYRALTVHFGSLIFASIVFCLHYPNLVSDTYLEGIAVWWFIPFLVLGFLVGFFSSILSLASLLIRPKAEANKLGLPVIPNAVLAQYKVGIPIIIVLLGTYFFWQSYAPYQTKNIGVLLFDLMFLKEVGQEFLRYYLRQDENGKRMSFRDSVKGLREAFNQHDYAYLLVDNSLQIKNEIGEVEGTPPEVIQKKIRHKYSPAFTEESINFKGKFLGKTPDGELKVRITFENNEYPEEEVYISEEDFEAFFLSYLGGNTISKDTDLEKATSYALNQSVIKSWQERAKESISINDLIFAGQVDLVRQKLGEQNIDLNQTSVGGWTPLLYASAQGYTEIMELLLNHAADPNLGNIKKITPLHYGARYNNLHVCKLLLDFGANPNLQDDEGWTPLMIAANFGNLKLVSNLLAAGAKPELKNDAGLRALDIAQRNKHGQVAKLLRKKQQ